MTKLHLKLQGLDSLPEVVQSEVIWSLRKTYGPLALRAGKMLVIGPDRGRQLGDLNLSFDTFDPPVPRGERCGHSISLGVEGEAVNVSAHRDMRVCGPVNPSTGKRDMRRILSNDRLMGKALGNAAIHELGHFIADLGHFYPNNGRSNYMLTGDLKGTERTLKATRKFFAGHQSFNEQQNEKLVTQIRKGEWLGDKFRAEQIMNR